MTQIPVACTLSRADLDKRQAELNALHKLICEIQHIQNGFALRFDGSTKNLMTIARVIAQERLCCRFLRFQLIAEPDAGSLWLEVSGPRETAQFLLEMFGFDANCSNLLGISCQC